VELLDAAIDVFVRYGFRKTSMDELARAAGLSRPGLYLHFSSKETLFQEAVAHLLDRSLARGRQALADPAESLQERLVGAFAAVHGPYVGKGAAAQHTGELIETAGQLAGDVIVAHERAFRAAVVEAIGGADAEALADTLDAVSIGLKHRVAALPEYLDRLRIGVAIVLAGRR
jgi:AcrR family transcriptional regulator